MSSFDELMANGLAQLGARNPEVAGLYFFQASRLRGIDPIAEFGYGICRSLLKDPEEAKHAYYRAIGAAGDNWLMQLAIRLTMQLFAARQEDFELVHDLGQRIRENLQLLSA